MKPIFLYLLLALTFVIQSPEALSKNVTSPPNIIIVVTDDQGKNDIGAEGNPYIKTPNIDDFYNTSVRFTNFHVSPTCTPTRGALMTGRHPNRLNVFHTISGRSMLLEDEQTLPQILAQSGYRTGLFGKWHLGDNYPFRPEDRGFQNVVRHGGGGIGQGPDYWGNNYFDDTYLKNGEYQSYKGYSADVFFDEALSFIESNKKQPFFAYIAINTPHGPLNVPEEYLDQYANNKNISKKVQRFYGMITNADDNFGRLIKKLELLNLDENTIVIFMSDNGTSVGHTAYDAGMTGNKGDITEGGHRVPFYMRWPAKNIQGGKSINQLTAHFDILPTLVDLAELKYLPVKPLDGTSLKPLLEGNTTSWKNRSIMIDSQRVLNLTKYKDFAVMDDKWRLMSEERLYDINKDLKQENNLYDQHPEVVERLKVSYELWWQSFIDEGADERYSYIKVGSPYENPTKINSHDLLSAQLGWGWNHIGATTAAPSHGVWKIEFVKAGKYKFTLRRFPVESKLAINATFPTQKPDRRIERLMPASTKNNFSKAFISVGQHKKSKTIELADAEIEFIFSMPSGKFDLVAELHDTLGVIHPAYYLYIEKM